MKSNSFRIVGKIVWIQLTQGKETCVDFEDWEEVSKYHWCAQKDLNTFYAVQTVKHNRKQLHQVVTGHKFQDHRDGNGLNNCRSNLRPSTSSQNAQNRPAHKGSVSGLKGVYWRKDREKWYAMIASPTKKGIYLGYFDDPISAARAYNVAALKHHGSFARLNPV